MSGHPQATTVGDDIVGDSTAASIAAAAAISTPHPSGALPTHDDSSDALLGSRSSDWHHLHSSRPTHVVVARSEQDVVAGMSLARQLGTRAVARGYGHGQGTALSSEGVVIDVSELRQVHSLSDDEICVGAGASWHDVLEALRPHGRTTACQTDWQGLSVGGILSVGGLGPGLFCYGPLVGLVSGFRLITGAGEVIDCSKQDGQGDCKQDGERDSRQDDEQDSRHVTSQDAGREKCAQDDGGGLYQHALGCLGQLGVLVSVRIATCPCPARARVYRVVTSQAAMLDGYRRAASHSAVHNLQTFPRLNKPRTLANLDPCLADFQPPTGYADQWIYLHEFVCFYGGGQAAGVGDDGCEINDSPSHRQQTHQQDHQQPPGATVRPSAAGGETQISSTSSCRHMSRLSQMSCQGEEEGRQPRLDMPCLGGAGSPAPKDAAMLALFQELAPAAAP